MKIKMFKDLNNSALISKEELQTLLKNYEGILTSSMLNYLECLINLEFSVVKDYILKINRQALSELEIYQKVAIYNIYHRALNILKNSNLDLNIYSEKEGVTGLIVYAKTKERALKLFDFNYENLPLGLAKNIPPGYKTLNIGDISLYKTLESLKKREKELARVMDELEKLYSSKNPYPKSNLYGSKRSTWNQNHARLIADYEAKFKELDSKQELTDSEKLEIAITQKINRLLLDDYGLTSKSFKIETVNNKNPLERTLVLKEPNLTIKNNIKYI